ncbi:SDR family oxidoreductase [Achromobacter deleyi]|uniref:SDR family oxidoreductase n=1 Tax=Achromobacter deleyi TaxID=1353891 RepID=A0A7T4B002_9BURK|nr:SDR family oxidoreductase [Achromobacter deleyi]QQB33114.1 SDR family oxidoreductase [Achromobacter deleyi]
MTRTVLLTGTSSGLGDAAARRFLDQGWNVVATARNPQKALVGLDHPNLLRTRLDVTDTQSVHAAFEEAETRFGEIDVVVNNAGIGLGGPLEGIDLVQLREHLEVNVVGVAAVCRIAIPRMRKQGKGLLINVSSAAGQVGLPYLSPYSAGKFAIEGLSEALRYELKPFGIRVKLIEPGGIRSRFSHIWSQADAYEPTTSLVRERMAEGALRAPAPEVTAATVVAAANDPSDKLRYRASDAKTLLRIWGLLPDPLWTKFVGKVFGLPRS